MFRGSLFHCTPPCALQLNNDDDSSVGDIPFIFLQSRTTHRQQIAVLQQKRRDNRKAQVPPDSSIPISIIISRAAHHDKRGIKKVHLRRFYRNQNLISDNLPEGKDSTKKALSWYLNKHCTTVVVKKIIIF